MKCTNPECQKEIFALLYSELGGVRNFTVYVEKGKLKYELDRNEPDEKTGFKCPYCGTVLAETEEEARILLQPVDREVCSICGRSIKKGRGLFVDRVQDFNTMAMRIEIGRSFPQGDYICRECDAGETVESGGSEDAPSSSLDRNNQYE